MRGVKNVKFELIIIVLNRISVELIRFYFPNIVRIIENLRPFKGKTNNSLVITYLRESESFFFVFLREC